MSGAPVDPEPPPPVSHSGQTVPLGRRSGPESGSDLPLSLPVGSVAFRVCGVSPSWLLPGLVGRSWVGPHFHAQGPPSFKDPSYPETTELQGCSGMTS